MENIWTKITGYVAHKESFISFLVELKSHNIHIGLTEIKILFKETDLGVMLMWDL